jgi:hypothetical protein
MLISGTFLQLYKQVDKTKPGFDWSAAEWSKEFDYLAQIGMKLIIIQYSVYDHEAYYFSKLAPAVVKTDQIETILSLADERKFKVMLGLTLTSSYWYNKKPPEYWDEEIRRNKQFVDELWGKYGHHQSFWGWYIPHEIDDVTGKPEPMRQLITKLLNEMRSYCHQKTPKLLVGIAPYFSNAMTPTEFEDWWTRTLHGAGIDILMLQDGVGCHRAVIERDIPLYYGALQKACKNTGVEFWTDLEIFDQIHCPPVDNEPVEKWAAVPADIKRIKAQIETTAPFVKRIVCFEFTHYMSPQMGDKQKKLFQDYINFVDYYHIEG